MPILGYPARPPGLVGTLLPGTRLGPVPADLGPIPWARVDDDGVEWHLTDLNGWWDSPDVVGQVAQRPTGHGAWLGPAFYAARAITLTGWIIAPDPQRRDQAVARLSAAAALTPTVWLTVDEYPQPTRARVRRSGTLKVDKRDRISAQVQVSLLAPDPRRYAVLAEPLTSLLTAAGTGGITPPLTPPLYLPEAPTGGRVLVDNVGNIDAPWLATISGPVRYPRLTNTVTGRVLQLDMNVPDGQYIDLDARTGQVLLSGSADRAGRIAYGTDWWLLPPGPTEVTFTGLAGSQPPALSFTPLICWS